MSVLKLILLFACIYFSLSKSTNEGAMAGAYAVNLGPPKGVPLAGYSAPPRRVSSWPLPRFTKYTAFMTPSEGVLQPVYVKCLALRSGEKSTMFISLDAIGASGFMTETSYKIAQRRGLKTPFENIAFGASHTHSSFGAVAKELLWSLAPATDIFQEKFAEEITTKIADCMINAEQRLQPARIGIKTEELLKATRNRRANISPHVNSSSVDPQLGIIKVDDLNGKPIATLWNYAVHGTCYGSSQMLANGDISGAADILIEQKGLGISLYFNGAAGDTAPASGMCDEKPMMKGSKLFADEVEKLRRTTQTYSQFEIQAGSVIEDFGLTQLNLTFERVGNCTSGGFMNICSICKFFNCNINLRLNNTWVENKPKFTGIRIKIDGRNYGFVTLPGEAVQELGFQIKDDAKKMGFHQSFILGYANNHMGYFTTRREYLVGGYESILSFWGIGTGDMVKNSAEKALHKVKPEIIRGC